MRTGLRLLPLLLLAAGVGGCGLFRPRPPEYDAVHHDSGLVIQDLVRPSTDLVARPGDRVSVHYEIRLTDGTVVDSSLDRGAPIEFSLVPGQVPLPGLPRGLVGMRVLGRRRLLVPPHLGYGTTGMPPQVPPDAELVIELELLEVNGATGKGK